jgi:subtilisin family serine protease
VTWLLLAVLLAPAERVRVVVAFADSDVTTATTLLQSASGVQRWGNTGVLAAEIEARELVALRRDPRVRAISVDAGGRGGLVESLPIIEVPGLRARGIDGGGTTVAVLDTGIDTDHPDFAGRITGERCFCDNLDGSGCCPGGTTERSGPGAAEDDNGHGTHVTGIAAGGGAVAAQGVAPRANIVAVKVMDSGNRFRSFTQIFQGLQWIADERPDVDVINMSLGSDALFLPGDCAGSAISFGLQPVIARLRDRGVLITASTGNNGSTTRTWLPACMDEVLGIGATYDTDGGHCGVLAGTPDDVACFTNSSASMDLLAPGVSTTASYRGGGTATLSGTSMAAPHVAGTIALLKQVAGRALPSDVVQDVLTRTGQPVVDTRNGLTFPRIDAGAAVDALVPPQNPRRRSVRH